MKRIILIPLLFIWSSSISQLNHLRIYTAGDGLPSTYVFCTYMRSNSEIIVGTANGFSRFNGISFSNYGYESGLSNLMVHALYEDVHKNMWLGTDIGMQLFENGRCITLPTSDGSTPGYVGSFLEFDNRLWVRTHRGIYYLKDRVWMRTPYKELEQACSGFFKYEEGLLFFMSKNIFLLRNGRLSKFKDFPDMKHNVVSYKDSGFYILTNHRDILFAAKGKKIQNIYSDPEEKINNFFLYRDWLWVFFESKPMIKINLRNHQKEAFPAITNPQSVSHFNKFILISGLHGMAKIAVNKNVNVLSKSVNDIRLIIPDASNQFSFVHSRESLFNIYKDQKIEPVTIQFKPTLNELLLDKGVSASGGIFWVISRAGELYKLNIREKKFHRFFQTASSVYDVAYDKQLRTTYASTGDKIYTLNERDIVTDSLHASSVFAMRTINKGGLIFYSNQSLFIRKNGHVKQCLKIKIPVYRKWDIRISESSNGLISLNVKGDGVRVYEWVNDSLIEKFSVNTQSGLRSNSVFMTTFDSLERLWILSDFGISIAGTKEIFSDKTVPLKNAGDLGINIANWEQATLALTHDNKMLLGTPKVSLSINANEVEVHDPPASVFLDYLQVEGDLSDHKRSKTVFFPSKEKVVLDQDENSFKIKFQSVSFSTTSEFLYSYRLIQGADSSWSIPGIVSSVSFYKLSAGNYKFEVRSRKPNTEWSEPAGFNFSVKPPFWETTLFKVIVVFNFLFFIIFIFQWRLRKVRRGGYVKAKLAELEMKALRAQLNPHFIYNALNSIQSLIATGNQKDAMRYVSKFGKLLRLILENSEEGKTTLQKELDVNSLYIQLEQLRLGFDFAVNIEIAEDIIPEDEKVPALIIQPILENALWHGLTNIKEDKQLSIDVTSTDVYLIIGISDNGLGIAATTQQTPKSSEKRKSFGSQIVRKRLMTYNGDDREPVHIRDLKEIGKQGTEVKLFIKRHVN